MPSLGLILMLLLVALPLLELAILIKVGAIIGVWAIFGIIFGTFILGINVVRHQGFGVLRRFTETARTGTPPVEPMVEAMLLMFAGACLIAPGLITDVIGLIFLIPPIRQAAARWVLASGFPLAVRVRRKQSPSRHPRENPTPTGHPPTIEADYERLDETPTRPRTPPNRDPNA
jgi:UPF0716 protein FxsA